MIYIGIDPSLTGTGIVLIDPDGNVLNKDAVNTKSSVPIESRMDDILDVISDMLPDPSQDAFVGIEGLSFGSKSSSMLQLAGLHYLLRYYLMYRWQLNFTVIPPQTLKKFVCGKGNVKKEQMLLQTYKKWGIEFQDNNICDAYCLARYVMEAGGKET